MDPPSPTCFLKYQLSQHLYQYDDVCEEVPKESGEDCSVHDEEATDVQPPEILQISFKSMYAFIKRKQFLDLCRSFAVLDMSFTSLGDSEKASMSIRVSIVSPIWRYKNAFSQLFSELRRICHLLIELVHHAG